MEFTNNLESMEEKFRVSLEAQQEGADLSEGASLEIQEGHPATNREEIEQAPVADVRAQKPRHQLFTLRELFSGGNEDLRDSFVQCYIDVFTARGDGEWGEEWDTQTVMELLSNDSDKYDPDASYVNLLIAPDEDGQDEVRGFFYGVLTDVDQISDFPAGHDDKAGEIKERVREVFELDESDKILAMKELGIRSDARTNIRDVAKLTMNVFLAAKVKGVHHFVFWTAIFSKLYKISQGFDFRRIYQFEPSEGDSSTERVYMGAEINNVLNPVLVHKLDAEGLQSMMVENTRAWLDKQTY